MKHFSFIILLIAGIGLNLTNAQPLNADVLLSAGSSENLTRLDGTWKFMLDPMEIGTRKRKYRRDFPADEKYDPSRGLIEYDWDHADDIQVPADWNIQDSTFFWYEGQVWYRKKFQIDSLENSRFFLLFEAVNYETTVWLNGHELGSHTGGFTPFHFEVSSFLRQGENSLVLVVSNKRSEQAVPAFDFDWFNYGGITRSVWLLKKPHTFVSEVSISWDGKTEKRNRRKIDIAVTLSGADKAKKPVVVSIPELKIKEQFTTDETGDLKASLGSRKLELWSPDNPRRYRIEISTEEDSWVDMVGFRSIKTQSTNIVLNGENIFLKGISIHEEAISGGRIRSKEQALELLNTARDLGCNFVRLAHYPHTETMTRLADSLGLLVWSEIPVYWEDIDYENPETFALASTMMRENIARDKNRASIVIWSVANETPIHEARNVFLHKLIDSVRTWDGSRLVSAAMNKTSGTGKEKIIDDPLGEWVDILGVNQYAAWYTLEKPEEIPQNKWSTVYDKPMIFSEFGAGALSGFYSDSAELWSEEYQADVYRYTLEMCESIPFLQGISPWILKDFRSPRRHHGVYQNYWNRKGLISHEGSPKKAYEVLRTWYINHKSN